MLPVLVAAPRRVPLLIASVASSSEHWPIKDYSNEARALFNNMRAPASLIAGVLLSATFALMPAPTDARAVAIVKRVHLMIGLFSSSATLLSVVICSIAINKLSEIKSPPTVGVKRLMTSDASIELAWLGANANFFVGLVGLVVLIGVRGVLIFSSTGCGLLCGSTSACFVGSAALLMVSLINTGIEQGDGSLSSPTRFGRSLFGLFMRYTTLLYQRARTAPLTALSLLCALGGSLLSIIGLAWMVW